MKNGRYRKLLPVLALLTMNFPALSRMPEINNAAAFCQDSFLQRSRYMSDIANYRGAIDALYSIATENIPLSPEDEEDFIFILGKAYFATEDPRCLEILNEFVEKYPASVNASEASLMIGDFYFFSHDWSAALEEYRKTDLSSLPSTDRNIYTYRELICMLRRGFYQEATPLVESLKGKKQYDILACYYDAYIDYVGFRNQSALNKFEKVAIAQNADNPVLSKILKGEKLYPEFYMAQCLFRLGEWEKCAKMSQGILKRNQLPEEEMTEETKRVYGLSLYELGDYVKAEGLLESYVDKAGVNAMDDAVYALGVCEYSSGSPDAAASRFSRLLDNHDILSQGSYLYLGLIEASRGNPMAAAIDFEKAYRMNYDNKVAESALYNYVAASSQGGNIPFDANVEMLGKFIEMYPKSQHTPAVERHLAWLCYQQGDYEGAVKAIDRIRRPSASDLNLKQMIYYAAGASALSQGNSAKAAVLLNKSVAIKSDDPSLTAQANIWLGDALYRNGDYPGAVKAYQSALKSGKAGKNEALLKYDLAYALFRCKKYSEALNYFRMLSGSLTLLTPEIRRDAAVRVADCKYLQGNYDGAKDDYSNLKSEGTGSDHASFRYARILGREGDLSGKARELERFDRDLRESPLYSEAMSELADTYSSLGEPAKAASAYSRIIERNPSDPASASAMLRLGQAYIDAGKTDKGIDVYRQLLSSRPHSEEAVIAEKELRHYYADSHQLDKYAEFLEQVPGYSLDARQLENLMFETAETEYLEKKGNITGLKEYLEKYPSGENVGKAYLYLAEYYDMKDDSPNALEAFRGLERFGGAEYQTEAIIGIMRHADNSARRVEYAGKVLARGGIGPEVMEEAEFYIASSQLKSTDAKEIRKGETVLERLSRNPFSNAGARSAVTLAKYYLDAGLTGKSVELMEDFTSSGSEEHYWVARGFIVLADAYKKEGKDYLSQEYLRILRDNYPGEEEDIKKMISTRLSR